MTTVIIPTGFGAVLYQILLVFAWLGSMVFPVWYGITRPWFKTIMGRHLMAYSCVVAISMSLVTVRPFFTSDPLRTSIAGILIIFSLGACGWWRAWIFFRVGKQHY